MLNRVLDFSHWCVYWFQFILWDNIQPFRSTLALAFGKSYVWNNWCVRIDTKFQFRLKIRFLSYFFYILILSLSLSFPPLKHPLQASYPRHLLGGKSPSSMAYSLVICHDNKQISGPVTRMCRILLALVMQDFSALVFQGTQTSFVLGVGL